MNDSDTLQRFLFDDGDVRGELVHMASSLQEALSKHDYPVAIGRLLGESLAATVLLSATLKMQGRVALQARGNGSVSLLMAECTDQRGVRGIVHGDAQDDSQRLRGLLGEGQLSIILEPENGQRYQGIVPLESARLSDCLEDYFTRSEQLETFILLACDGQHAAGLMLQKMPGRAGDSDLWERLTQLAATTSEEELLTLAPDELLHRLFHEENLQRYPAQPVTFYCHCSRERTEDALHTLGAEECYELLATQESIDVDCQFCHEHYRFVQKDLERLFGPPRRH
ncbi:MAG: Hsp33 family molecular chaperone HslO [Oleiphilaceae bacterium]|nr:Hsp33 family molecular chaperone HslO [Oleiphilaceae bacterium]